MKKLEIGIVAEGVTDFMLLRSLLKNFFDCNCQLIQPETSDTQGGGNGGNQGTFGGGWKGVRAWCQNLSNDFQNLAAYLKTVELDILIIHIDADVARDNEINCAIPCPPAKTPARHWHNKSTIG
jgi:hypothetical protein